MRRLASIHVAYSLGLGAFEAGDPDHALRELEALRKVTPAEAQAAARKHLAGKIPLVVVVE